MVVPGHAFREVVLGCMACRARTPLAAVRLLSSQYQAQDGFSSMFLRSGSAGVQMCSPMRDISTWLPHDEHLMVGRNMDSRGTAMVTVCCVAIGEDIQLYSTQKLFQSALKRCRPVSPAKV